MLNFPIRIFSVYMVRIPLHTDLILGIPDKLTMLGETMLGVFFSMVMGIYTGIF